MNAPLPTITVRTLAMVLPLRDIEEKRGPTLNSVLIEPCRQGGVIMVCTDGIVMGVARDIDGEAEVPVLWRPSRALLQLADSYKGNVDAYGDAYAGPVDSQQVQLSAPTWGEQAGDKFPAWRNVMPRASAEGPAEPFNPLMLARFARWAEIEGITRPTMLRSRADNEFPYIIFHLDCPNFYGAIMPQKSDQATVFSGLPSWLARPMPAEPVP